MANNKDTLKSLKPRQEFLNLKKEGQKSFYKKWLLVNFSGSEESLMLGCTIPKYVGKAVVRNRLKRWTKEIVRAHLKKGALKTAKVNVIFRKQENDFYKNLTYEEYKNALESILKQLARRL